MTDLDLAQAALAATDAWLEAHRERDMEWVSQAFAAGMDVVVFGTGPDEHCKGLDKIRERLERDWIQAEASSIERGRTTTRAAGGAVVVAFDCHFGFCIDEHNQTTSGRGTFVFELQHTHLTIVHAHFLGSGRSTASGALVLVALRSNETPRVSCQWHRPGGALDASPPRPCVAKRCRGRRPSRHWRQ